VLSSLVLLLLLLLLLLVGVSLGRAQRLSDGSAKNHWLLRGDIAQAIVGLRIRSSHVFSPSVCHKLGSGKEVSRKLRRQRRARREGQAEKGKQRLGQAEKNKQGRASRGQAEKDKQRISKRGEGKQL
jgi:hypothetical protein